MWIYYYASFGPGHQSHDYDFKYFHDSYDREDIKEHLFNFIDSCGYSIILNFWEVERPPAEYTEGRIKSTKKEIKSLKERLKMLESISCFVPEQKEGVDVVLQKNISNRVTSNLLERLHRAGFMYGADDISAWRFGKKCLTEPSRSKILRIIRRSKSYPPIKSQLKRK